MKRHLDSLLADPQTGVEFKALPEVSVMVSNKPSALRKGDSIFTKYRQPDGRIVWVLNRTVYEEAVESGRESLRRAYTLAK